jgi:hypothetical protein
MDILRDGSPAGHAPLSYKQGTGAIPFLAMLPTKTLSPGLYDITARMTQGGKKAESTISFSVPGNRPVGAALAEGDAALRQELQPRKNRQLEFTVPETPLPPPSWQEFESVLADAGQHALAYRDSLPDFLCVKVTDRSVDANNSSNWKHKDSIAEMLRYHDKAEAWTVLQVDGKPAIGKVERGSQSAGEFGEVLKAIFQPSSKADFKWKEAQLLGKRKSTSLTIRLGSRTPIFRSMARGARG